MALHSRIGYCPPPWSACGENLLVPMTGIADLLNLGKLQGLWAPVASIGGAGTFDGIFVTGLIAVLLAGLTGTRTAR
jgi:hypothetical protein